MAEMSTLCGYEIVDQKAREQIAKLGTGSGGGNFEGVVPTKVSELTNDVGYITADSVPTKVSELNNDAGYITADSIPTKVSELTNDTGYITTDDVPTKTSELNNDSGYITTDDVPTKVSEFTNDAGYITASYVESNDSAVRYVKDEADENFDWIQVKNSEGEWINAVKANTLLRPLYMTSANEGGFAAYEGSAGSDTGLHAWSPTTVTFGESMVVQMNGNGSGGGCSVMTELIDMTRFKKIKLNHKSTTTVANQHTYVRLFVTSVKQKYMGETIISSIDLISNYAGTKEDPVELDISALEGKYYIGICCHTGGSLVTTEISNMYME